MTLLTDVECQQNKLKRAKEKKKTKDSYDDEGIDEISFLEKILLNKIKSFFFFFNCS